MKVSDIANLNKDIITYKLLDASVTGYMTFPKTLAEVTAYEIFTSDCTGYKYKDFDVVRLEAPKKNAINLYIKKGE